MGLYFGGGVMTHVETVRLSDVRAARLAVAKVLRANGGHVYTMQRTGGDMPRRRRRSRLARWLDRRVRFAKLVGRFLVVVFGPRVSQNVFDARMAACTACSSMKQDDDSMYCKACGCWNWGPAELTRKLWWANLDCPKKQFRSDRGVGVRAWLWRVARKRPPDKLNRRRVATQ